MGKGPYLLVLAVAAGAFVAVLVSLLLPQQEADQVRMQHAASDYRARVRS